jgi:hypothetical protein
MWDMPTVSSTVVRHWHLSGISRLSPVTPEYRFCKRRAQKQNMYYRFQLRHPGPQVQQVYFFVCFVLVRRGVALSAASIGIEIVNVIRGPVNA